MAKEKNTKEKVKNVAEAKSKLPPVRGRVFEGFVTKKFAKRVVVEFERNVYVPKYERFYKKKTKIHARLPDSMIDDVNVGDYIEVRECRPLSKIIHFIVIRKVRSASEGEK